MVLEIPFPDMFFYKIPEKRNFWKKCTRFWVHLGALALYFLKNPALYFFILHFT
jgi:hypothetical protein